MLLFKCRQLFTKNAKIWRLFSLRNKNKSRNLDLKSDNAGNHSDQFNSTDVNLQEAECSNSANLSKVITTTMSS